MSSATSMSGGTRDRSGYLFVDNIRFLSMAAVVALHSLQGFGPLLGLNSKWFNAVMQPFKFASISFFLISGFLMGKSLTRSSPVDYMKRRLNTVFAPWLIWFSLFFVSWLLHGIVHSWLDPLAPHGLFLLAADSLSWTLFKTAFWFVPNLLLSVGFLLFCRRFLFDLRLGAAFLVVSAFYALNLYFNWLPIKSHTEAFFGFIFYLWLGAWAARNLSQVETAIERIPSRLLIAIVILLGVLATQESFLLFQNGSQNQMDTLRFSNQLYSVFVVIFIFKLRRTMALKYISIRETTFGIYLTHSIILLGLIKAAKLSGLRGGMIRGHVLVAPVIPVVLVAGFVVTYSLSIVATQCCLSRPRLRWTVGGNVLSSSRSPLELVSNA